MRKMCELVMAVSLVCAGLLQAETIRIPKIAEAPRIDGALDEPVWQQALITEYYRPDSVEPAGDTTVRLAYDARYLYVGIICSNANMAHVIQQTTGHDGAVNLDESVEIFLRPDAGSKRYYHLMLNFAGVQHDKRITEGGKREMDWDPAWRARTRRTDGGWTAEIAFPWHTLESESVETLQINIIRNAREIGLDAYGALENEKRVARVLQSGARGSPHDFKNFLSVGGLDVGKIMFPPRIMSVEAQGYRMAKSGVVYELAVIVEPATDSGGEVDVVVLEEEDGKEVERHAEKVVLELGARRSMVLAVPAKSFNERAVRVQLRAIGSPANVLGEREAANTAALNIFQKVFVGRSYYTDEPAAEIFMKLGATPDVLREMTAKVAINGKNIVKQKGVQESGKLDVPLNKLSEGANEAVVSLEMSKREVARQALEIRRLPPKPGCEIKVDHTRQALLKDGKPYFPFALFASRLSEEALREVADAGWTTIIRWNMQVPATQTLATAGVAGLDVFDNPYHPLMTNMPGRPEEHPWNMMPRDAAHQRELMATLDKGLAKAIPEIEEDIRKIRDFPNLVGYYTFDEPTLLNTEARLAAARAIMGAVRKMDPYRPVFCGFSRRFPERPDEVADIFSHTVYLTPGKGGSYGFAGEMTGMTVYMLRLKAGADKFNRPGMGVALTESLDPLRSPRGIMPDEKRCSTYLSVIHGVKGIFHWVDLRLLTQVMWDTLSALAKEMRVIGPAALSGEVYPAAHYAPVAFDLRNEIFPDVQATLFKNPAGGYLLLAANTALYPVDVHYAVPGIKAAAGVTRLFKEQKLAADEHGFSDQLEPYGTRAYSLELAAEAVKPVALALEMTPHPDKALTRKRFKPEEDFRNKKNFMANPSFEDAEVEFFPDYAQPVFLPTSPRLGQPGAPMVMDPEKPVHGKYSLRETIKLPCGAGKRGMVSVCYPPNTNTPFRVTLSVYVKATENVKMGYVSMAGMRFDNAAAAKLPGTAYFTPTTEWKRHVFAGELDYTRIGPALGRKTGDRFAVTYWIGPGNIGALNPWQNSEGKHAVLNVPYKAEFATNAAGTAEFWVDAVQLELGGEATEFTTE